MAEALERREVVSRTAKNIARRFLRHENSALVFVLIGTIGVFSVVTHGLSTSGRNLINILLQSSIRGVASMGQAFVILSGGIDISVGGMGLLVAHIGAAMMTSDASRSIVVSPMHPYIVIPIMLLLGATLGAFNGSLVSRIGLPSLIVTLGMWEIGRGLSFVVAQGYQLTRLPRSLAFFGQGYIAGFPVPVIIFITVFVVAYFILYHTTLGRSVYAVGGNPLSAWLSGINVKRIQLTVFVISGLLAGLAGVITTGRIMSATMYTLRGLEIDTIAAVCIGGVSLMGGRGNLIGVLLGVLIIGVINNGISILGAAPDTQSLVKGGIIIAAVAIDYLRRR